MAAAAVPGDKARVALPFVVDAEPSRVRPGGWPRGGVTRLELPNRHLEYALTWYGLALTLIGVFAAFAVTPLAPAARLSRQYPPQSPGINTSVRGRSPEPVVRLFGLSPGL